ncbi:MAG: response regulator [Patescibacteria group bacterium]
MDQKHILLVEDDAIVIESIVYTLEKAGYSVEHTVSGKLGVEIALKSRPNLIIADLLLPDMNGAEMIAEIRMNPWGKNAKIIVLTNLDEAQMKIKLSSLNILRYLLKVDNSLAKITEVVNDILK